MVWTTVRRVAGPTKRKVENMTRASRIRGFVIAATALATAGLATPLAPPQEQLAVVSRPDRGRRQVRCHGIADHDLAGVRGVLAPHHAVDAGTEEGYHNLTH